MALSLSDKKNKASLLLKAILLTALPFFCCLFNLAVQGKSFNNISLLTSNWTDELYYYKQVQAILSTGLPQGPFGYNESAAQILTFGSWNPIILLPWVIWGAVFGWTLSSPYIFNIVFWGICLGIICLILKPNYKQVITIYILSLVNPIFSRYLLSMMSEAYIWGLVLVFYAIAFNEILHSGRIQRIILWALGSFLTLTRPYLAVLLILLVFIYCREQKNVNKKFISLAVGLLAIAVIIFIYFLICNYFTAEFWDTIINYSWLDTLKTLGFISGIKELCGETIYILKEIYYRMYKTITQNMVHGTYYILFTVVVCIYLIGLFILIFKTIKQKTDELRAKLIITTHFILSSLLIFLAVILMYNITDGDRHLLIFIIVGAFLLPILFEQNSKIKIGTWNIIPEMLLLVVFVYFIWIKCAGNINYFVPALETDSIENAEIWKNTFDENMTLTDDFKSYDNVIDLLYYDDSLTEVYEGYVITDTAELNWQCFYEIPEGFGISMCSGPYLKDNLNSLKAGYIVVVSGGLYDELCTASNIWTEIRRDENIAFYKKTSLCRP